MLGPQVLWFTAGVLLFIHGFFLTRRQIDETSVCDLNSLAMGLPAAGAAGAGGGEGTYATFAAEYDLLMSVAKERKEGSRGCWAPATHGRVFVFVVDALRLDFMTSSSSPSSSPAASSMMPRMHALLTENATQTRFFGFKADPPTVTAQRLKGLTTGSLPTFIDAGSNVASAAITEDNWLDQLLRHAEAGAGVGTGSHNRSSSVLLGDDTWLALFPGRFTHARPFESFDTRDLHTVDDGVEKELQAFLAQGQQGQDWRVFVAHFLGVDHIGHTHHAAHPLMSTRVRRMDSLMARVIEALPEDALFLLFGDHGMTDDGNHGGASAEETDSGLFVYSRRPFPLEPDAVWHAPASAPASTSATASSDTSVHKWDTQPVQQRAAAPRMVAQVDLVPSLALLLGLPVPYSSLGGLVPELLASRPTGGEADTALLDAWLVNCLQVLRYFRSYGHPEGQLQGLASRLSRAMQAHIRAKHISSGKNKRKDALRDAFASYSAFLQQALELGRRMFTSFDLRSMALGCVLLLAAVAKVATELLQRVWWARRPSGESSAPAPPLDLRTRLYCGCVWAWAAMHAMSGFGDTGIRWEVEAHLLACTGASLLLLRCLALPWTRYLAALLSLAAAAVMSWAHADLTREAAGAGAGLYAASVLLWAVAVQRYSSRHLQDQQRLCWGSLCAFLCSAALAAVQFYGKSVPGARVPVVWAARGALLLSAAALVVVMQRLSASPPLQSGLLDARLLHAAAHACALLSVVTGPLLLPVFTCFVLHVRAHAPLSPDAPTPASATAPATAPAAGGRGLTSSSFHCLLATSAVHGASLARALFFGSGHRLGFGALQLEAGLVGAAAFDAYWGAALLVLNTFGAECICLWLLLRCSARAHVLLPQEPPQALALAQAPAKCNPQAFLAAMSYMLYRMLCVTCSACTALLLRRHLMVWAVFAPKLFFEMAFWFVQAAVLLGSEAYKPPARGAGGTGAAERESKKNK